ncbi:MAG: DciA family protein [Alphaproteobacteria bacterium]|nr:DciA family protein [Alphaproteobacteria bacterium]
MSKTSERKDRSRRGATQQVGALLPALTRRALGKHGFSTAALVTDWHVIVGTEVAENCQPERLAFPRGKRSEGVLHIRTSSAYALELQHIEPQVVERINVFLGYAAISRLKLIHAPRRGGPDAGYGDTAGATANQDRTSATQPTAKGARALEISLARLAKAIRENESKCEK